MRLIREKRVSRLGVGPLCRLFGKSRQAFYGKTQHLAEDRRQELLVLELVAGVRRELPFLGLHKLHWVLREPLKTHEIKIGRDKLHKLLQRNGLMLRRTKRNPKTTDSKHWMKRYPNLIVGLEPLEPEIIWVADITYVCVGYDFNYLFLLTDTYSHKVVGYHLSTRLDSEGAHRALEMAVASSSGKLGQLIHHSDRGVQYCSFGYVQRLREIGTAISMGEEGTPYENPIAERMNGILKAEFGLNKLFPNHQEAKRTVDLAIQSYNHKRPHMSCDYLTPAAAHHCSGRLNKRWYPKKYPYRKKSLPTTSP